MSTAGLIAAGVTTAANFVSDFVKSRRDEKRYQKELADSRANWRMQNDYNSPESQMKRLKAAGLNPNLVYQQGGALSGAGEISTTSHADSPLSDYSNLAPMAVQFDSALAAIDESKSRTRLSNAQAYDLEKHNEEFDKAIGFLRDSEDLNNHAKEYYASLAGVDPNSMSDLSARGANILADLRSKFKNNDLLDQTYSKIFHESDKLAQDAELARLAVLFSTAETSTELLKNGFSGKWSNHPNYGDYLSGIKRDPSKLNMVLERFSRELKEIHWQSSDAKHIIDSTSSVLGSLPKLKFSKTPEEYYKKHKK